MKTYCESKKEKAIDWNSIVEKLINNDFTENELTEWKSLSKDWVTCACGNQCEIIPRGENGHPLDIFLWKYGNDFFYDIHNARYNNAKDLLFHIEQRSSFLINEINEQKPKTNS